MNAHWNICPVVRQVRKSKYVEIDFHPFFILTLLGNHARFVQKYIFFEQLYTHTHVWKLKKLFNKY